ncbi:rhomboid family intramembrane serine protease [Exiguobacterium sp. 9-2]|nr:rhomboid family intramembrane serine protease [Exiguobacterium sp. 9-2]
MADDTRLVYIFTAVTAVFTLLGSNVAVFGHLYGFVLGFLFGFVFGNRAVPCHSHVRSKRVVGQVVVLSS